MVKIPVLLTPAQVRSPTVVLGSPRRETIPLTCSQSVSIWGICQFLPLYPCHFEWGQLLSPLKAHSVYSSCPLLLDPTMHCSRQLKEADGPMLWKPKNTGSALNSSCVTWENNFFSTLLPVITLWKRFSFGDRSWVTDAIYRKHWQTYTASKLDLHKWAKTHCEFIEVLSLNDDV